MQTTLHSYAAALRRRPGAPPGRGSRSEATDKRSAATTFCLRPHRAHGVLRPRSLPHLLTENRRRARRIRDLPSRPAGATESRRRDPSDRRLRRTWDVVNARPQAADEGQVAVQLAVIEAVADDIVVGDLETDVAQRHIDQAAQR